MTGAAVQEATTYTWPALPPTQESESISVSFSSCSPLSSAPGLLKPGLLSHVVKIYN